MAEQEPIYIEPESDTAKLLRLVRDEPISIESEGVRYRIERESTDPFANYDPVRVLVALRKSAGALAGIDVEAFKEEIREQRTQAPRSWER